MAPPATPTIDFAAPATQRTPVIAPLEPPIAATAYGAHSSSVKAQSLSTSAKNRHFLLSASSFVLLTNKWD